MLACVNLSSGAVLCWDPGWEFSVPGGSCTGDTSAFSCQDSLAYDFCLRNTYLPVVSVPSSGHQCTSCLPSAARLEADGCSVALLRAAQCRWNPSQKWTSWRNNPPASPRRRGPFMYVYIQKKILSALIAGSSWNLRLTGQELAEAFALQENLTAAQGQPKLTRVCLLRVCPSLPGWCSHLLLALQRTDSRV